MKPHFFCDMCNAQVDAEQPSCPNCGASFLGVRCPACQHSGEVSDFLNGCPSCGYNMQNQSIQTTAQRKGKRAKKTKSSHAPWTISIGDLMSLTIALIIVMFAFILVYFFRS